MRTVFVRRDCGCAARWAGDELVVHPCETHALEWVPDLERIGYAGPPTLIAPPTPRGGRVHHGVN